MQSVAVGGTTSRVPGRAGNLAHRVRANSSALSLWTFAAVDVALLPIFARLARFSWFSGDEFDFLSARTAGNLGDLFRPHNEHWSTLPILTYRLLWTLVGLRSYIPYLVVGISVHLINAALLRVVMRRADVWPWLATILALTFALYGSGYFNILYPFQIGFNGALAFGLVYLLLVDNDAPLNRNDILGVAAGLASLMCSGVGVTMVLIVGIAVVLRRGVRIALLLSAPLAGCYTGWYLSVGRSGYTRSSGVVQAVEFGGVPLTV